MNRPASGGRMSFNSPGGGRDGGFQGPSNMNQRNEMRGPGPMGGPGPAGGERGRSGPPVKNYSTGAEQRNSMGPGDRGSLLGDNPMRGPIGGPPSGMGAMGNPPGPMGGAFGSLGGPTGLMGGPPGGPGGPLGAPFGGPPPGGSILGPPVWSAGWTFGASWNARTGSFGSSWGSSTTTSWIGRPLGTTNKSSNKWGSDGTTTWRANGRSYGSTNFSYGKSSWANDGSRWNDGSCSRAHGRSTRRAARWCRGWQGDDSSCR